MYSYGPLHMAEQKQGDQFQPEYSSSVRIRDVALRTCRKRLMIGRVARDGQGHPCWWHDKIIMMIPHTSQKKHKLFHMSFSSKLHFVVSNKNMFFSLFSTHEVWLLFWHDFICLFHAASLTITDTNCIWWKDSTSEELRSMEYPFIAINFMPTVKVFYLWVKYIC